MAHEARFSYDTLHLFAREVLAAAGAPPSHCTAVADHLIDSNLAGHDSHGAHRLLQYTDAIEQGGIDPKATPRTVRDTATTAVLDATAVFGQVAGLAATELAIAKGRASGTAMVGVRNANHVGRAGVYALRMAAAGLVGQVFCSGRGAGIVAPWGGTTPILSTNPIAVAVPTAGDPVVLDCTTSVTAEGKVRVARFAGKELPPGQILDREGRPSIRPDDFYDGGSMLPLGADMGHTGYGMSVIVDLVGAMLAGGHAGAARGRRAGFSNNFTLWAADPEALGGRLHDCHADADGNLWIIAAGTGVVQKYSRDGELLLRIGEAGRYDSSDGTRTGEPLNSDRAQFFLPAAIDIDAETGEIYVADGELPGGNQRIAVLSRDGEFLRQWPLHRTDDERDVTPVPHCLRVSGDGLVYVCDREADRIQVFDREGTFIGNIDVPWEPLTPSEGRPSGTRGTAVVVAFSPDPEQRWLYVVNQNRVMVDVLDRRSGEVVSSFGGGPGRYPGQFTLPHGIGVDSNGHVYVAEQEGRRIQKFRRVGP